MTDVVCYVTYIAGQQLRLVWADTAQFEPYVVENTLLRLTEDYSRKVRANLHELTHACMDGKDTSAIARRLAENGGALYTSIFGNLEGSAGEAKLWLDALIGREDLSTVEFVYSGPAIVPWNCLFTGPQPNDGTPLDSLFWDHFLGYKYPLSVTRRVSPLRRHHVLDNRNLLIVADPSVMVTLGQEANEQVSALADLYGHAIGNAQLDAVGRAITDRAPGLIYWMSHGLPGKLILGGRSMDSLEVHQLVKSTETRRIAFLNACSSGESSASGSHVDAFIDAGFGGLVATEEVVINRFAHTMGHSFLSEFLSGRHGAAVLLRDLRRRIIYPSAVEGNFGVPLGLLYTAFCPPYMCVTNPAIPQAAAAAPGMVGGEALALGPAAALPELLGGDPVGLDARGRMAEAPDSDRAEAPYPSLAPYGRRERHLFTGRDQDVERFAALLEARDVSAIFLHGESGAGKTSFLRAGLLPYLEYDCVELRSHDMRTEPSTEYSDAFSSAVFARSSARPALSFAKALVAWCSRPIEYWAHGKRSVEIDLPGIIRKVVECPQPGSLDELSAAVARWLVEERGRVALLLRAVTHPLPNLPLLVIDQAEEVLTLRAELSLDDHKLELGFLADLHDSRGNFKVVLSLRTEFYGRLLGALRSGPQLRTRGAEYLLAELNASQLATAIRYPTAERFEFGFEFEDQLPEKIAEEVLKQAANSRDSALPLLQVVCAQLYASLRQAGGRVITDADFQSRGGFSGGLRTHVEAALKDAYPQHTPRDNPLRSLMIHLALPQRTGMWLSDTKSRAELTQWWSANNRREALNRVLSRGTDFKLLRLSGDSVSLGHDALALVANEWREADAAARRRRTRLIWFGIFAGAMVGLTVLAGVALTSWRDHSAKEASRAAEEERDRQTDNQVRKAQEEQREKIQTQMRALLTGNVRPPSAAPTNDLGLDASNFGGTYCLEAEEGRVERCEFPTEAACSIALSASGPSGRTCQRKPSSVSCYRWSSVPFGVLQTCYRSPGPCEKYRRILADIRIGAPSDTCVYRDTTVPIYRVQIAAKLSRAKACDARASALDRDLSKVSVFHSDPDQMYYVTVGEREGSRGTVTELANLQNGHVERGSFWVDTSKWTLVNDCWRYSPSEE